MCEELIRPQVYISERLSALGLICHNFVVCKRGVSVDLKGVVLFTLNYHLSRLSNDVKLMKLFRSIQNKYAHSNYCWSFNQNIMIKIKYCVNLHKLESLDQNDFCSQKLLSFNFSIFSES
jgi:hypothetical protein